MRTAALPYPDIPYGAAPGWSFACAEWTMLLLLLLCGVDAVRRQRRGGLEYLLGGFLFGLLLEYMEVQSGSYTYGRFGWMLGRAPLAIPVCIGAGWGIILYTSRLFSDALKLPLVAAAALDTLLALNIDLSMDAVAYRMHMWHWYWAGTGLNPLKAQWFGVPYGNFVGWATVIFCYSAFSRLWERKLAPNGSADVVASEPGAVPERGFHGRFVAVALLALVCSQAVLFSLEAWVWAFLRDHLGLSSGRRLLLIFAAMFMLTGLGWRKRAGVLGRVPVLAVWVPCWFHFYFLFCFVWFHFFRENAWMCAAAAANLAAGIVIHLAPSVQRKRASQLKKAPAFT